MDRNLVLIGGPIAAGKTTTARGLAAHARSEGIVAASIDMDEMIEMVAGSDWAAISREQRVVACRLTGRLIDAAFANGAGLLVIAGSTLSGYEWDEVTAGLESDPCMTRVLLRVSLEESIRRAQDDPTRVSTREPAFVAKLTAAIDWASVAEPEIEVDTDAMTTEQVVERIARSLTPSLRRPGEAS